MKIHDPISVFTEPNPIDFYKLDVYRFNIEKLGDNLFNININNNISWDNMNIKATKEELKGLANFINKHL